jgi:hypothetical protein
MAPRKFFKINNSILNALRPHPAASRLESLPAELSTIVVQHLGIDDCENLATTSSTMANFLEGTNMLSLDPNDDYDFQLCLDHARIKMTTFADFGIDGRPYRDDVRMKKVECGVCGGSVLVLHRYMALGLVQHVKDHARAGQIRLGKHMVWLLWFVAMMMSTIR